jgi:type II secretory pathway pseudopilin PulG
MNSRKTRHAVAGASLLEFLLILSIIALAAATILPSIRKTREAIAVERTARALEYCNDAISRILKNQSPVTNREDIAIWMINKAFRPPEVPPVWPREADMASFDPTPTNGPTIHLKFVYGPRTNIVKVTVDDATSPR